MKLQVQVVFGKNAERMKSFLPERRRIRDHVRNALLGQYFLQNISVLPGEYASAGSLGDFSQWAAGRVVIWIEIQGVEDRSTRNDEIEAFATRRTANCVIAIGEQNDNLPNLWVLAARQFPRDTGQCVIKRSCSVRVNGLEPAFGRCGVAISRTEHMRLQSRKGDDGQLVRRRELLLNHESADYLQRLIKVAPHRFARVYEYDDIESGFTRVDETAEVTDDSSAVHNRKVIAGNSRDELIVLICCEEGDADFRGIRAIGDFGSIICA